MLCLGPVPEFPERPALELDGWAFARPLKDFVCENRWNQPEPGQPADAAGARVATTMPSQPV
ncbi:cob [Mycobacterium tuberculosis]|nr:cob [Mycobacterium tuberculosis]